MSNLVILKQLHKTLREMIELMRRDDGIKRFPKFVAIYQRISLALDDDAALKDQVFLEDIKKLISGMYSGTTGSFSDYGVWLDDKVERQSINRRFNFLRDELPRLARSLQTKETE